MKQSVRSSIALAETFFRNIWLADELGSGIRKLYRYVPRYSGKPPELLDGDIFRIIVPFDDSYSFDAEMDKVQLKGNGCTLNCTLTEKAILKYLYENPTAKQAAVAAALGKSLRTVKNEMIALQEKGLLEREGAKKNGRWILK